MSTKSRKFGVSSKWNLLLLLVVLLGLFSVPSMAEDAAADDAAADDGASEDDDYVDLSGEDFDGMSSMPVSCVNYMNGHMIKFEMYENSGNFQCHSNNKGTFVVSISHYMRAYFNYQSLVRGEDFKLPSDAGYLNCVLLQQTAYSSQKLYAKIGCLERETYTSTKLRIHVYTDKQCSEAYDDGQSDDQRKRNGYEIDGYKFSTKVSFRPPFYSCASCKPQAISSTFSKQGTFWYDDDAAANGQQIYKYFDDWLDDYFLHDDKYFYVQNYVGNEVKYYKEDDDDFYTQDDDRRRLAEPEMKTFTAAAGELERFEGEMKRELYNDDGGDDTVDDSVKSWNMCSKVYKYGVWCDEDCRSLDTFRLDEWSKSDVFLLAIMFVFMSSMMLFIIAKRVKMFDKASIYSDDENPDLGIPPFPMGVMFLLILGIVVVMAVLRLVNETLVVAVVSCILLFIYMLKLTLFETKDPLLGNSKKAGDYNNFGGNHLFT